MEAGGLGPGAHLVGARPGIELQLDQGAAGEVDAEVEAEDGDAHQDGEVETELMNSAGFRFPMKSILVLRLRICIV